jgi:hypothetical protein
LKRRHILTGLVLPFAAAAIAVALVAAGLGFEALPFCFLLVVAVGFAFAARGVIPIWPRSWRGRGQAVSLIVVAGCLYFGVAALAAAGCVAGVSGVEERRQAAALGRYRRDLDDLVAAREGVEAVRRWAEGNGLSFAVQPAAVLVVPPAHPPPDVAAMGVSYRWLDGLMGGRLVVIRYYFRDDNTLARYEVSADRPSL